MSLDSLSKYLRLFERLHRNRHPKWGVAPHKPVLLLAVFDEIERGHIRDNHIIITPELVATFRAYWRTLVPPATWLEKIANPFRFMVHDGFWELVKDGRPISAQSLGDNPTVRQLTTEVHSAALASDLWQLLQNRTALNALRAHLLHEHFSKETAEVQSVLPASPIDYEAERLKAEAQSKFKIKTISENKDETGYFVRHALFPRVVKTLYHDACAVCGLNVTMDNRSGLVDAAHILPFAAFHNDDPRNGIALCKNHHWGFDAGWFTLTEDYRVTISPRLRDDAMYLTRSAPLLLPTQSQYAPALDALFWHRSNVFKR